MTTPVLSFIRKGQFGNATFKEDNVEIFRSLDKSELAGEFFKDCFQKTIAHRIKMDAR